MSIVSYAQNCEDIMLLRVLSGVSEGFYIDVGAQDPTVDSVTRLFYERGWSGVNIDPVLHWHAKLEEQRPRDINLCVAAGDHSGQISLFEITGTGLSTTVSEVARRHQAAGREVVERGVSMATLDEICAAHGIDQAHFLKIDVEGAEASVLGGISFDRIRPWIILIEATQPNTQVPTHEAWESMLTSKGYQFVYADGLNRFYLADEQQQLRTSFAMPPNYFDDFITYREQTGREYAGELESKLANLHVEFSELHGQLEEQHAQNVRVQEALDRVATESNGMRKQINELNAHGNELRAQNVRVQDALDRVVAENNGLVKRIQVVNAAAENRANRIQQLTAELHSSTVELETKHGDLQLLLKTAKNRQTRIVELEGQHADIAAKLEAARDEIAQRDATLQLIFSSRSWWLTKPLRLSRRLMTGLARRSLVGPVRAFGRFVLKMPWVRGVAHRLLASHPSLRTRLSTFLFGATPVESVTENEIAESAPKPAAIVLSARESKVLSILEHEGRSNDSVAGMN